jgi:hypothetical protein
MPYEYKFDGEEGAPVSEPEAPAEAPAEEAPVAA